MPSRSYRFWRTIRARALDEIADAHVAVGGTARGRRFATQQINQAYAVLLAAQFQGFCRDLHSECVEILLDVIAPATLRPLLHAEMTRGRQLDRGNAQPSSLASDFDRFDMKLWDDLKSYDAESTRWNHDLELLNSWRNAIVHQDFTSPKLGAIINLRLRTVRHWRQSCGRLARAIDNLMRGHLARLTGAAPW